MIWRAIAFLLCVGLARGATIYVDNAATGSNNGTSWANAYTNNPTAAQVAPGDTVYISGGSTSKTYTWNLLAVESGSSGSPITYRIGQDAGHNGMAIFPVFSFETYQWIVFDGGRTTAYTAPVAITNLTWTNNIGFRATRTNATGLYANGAAGQNNTARYIEIGPIGTTNNIGDIHAVQLNNLTAMTNFVLERLWIHDVQNDGINLNSVTTNPDGFDRFIVRYCLIENTGDDGIQAVRNGFTCSHNWLRSHWLALYNGHPDQLQLSGASSKYLKVINSIFSDKANSLIIGEHLVDEGATLGPFIIAGNIFANHRDWAYNVTQAYGATFAAWRPNADTSVLTAALSNFYFLNNTIYYQATTPFVVGRAEPDGGTRSVWQLYVTNGAVRNNLQIDSKYNAPSQLGSFIIHGNGAPGSGTNGVYYSTNDFPATHNIIAGPNRSMSYNGFVATNANAHGLNNSTNMPNIETNNYTFVLDATDTVAKDQGFSLSALTNTYPELMTDLYGNARGTGSGWDIGAVEYSTAPITNGLLLWLKFDDDLEDGIATDSSPEANHGKHFGYVNDQAASNRFPDNVIWTNKVTGITNGAARFRRTNDGWQPYGYSGDYIAITNLTNLRQLPAATIMFWHVTEPHDSVAMTNYVTVNNMRPLGAGYGYRGAWTLGYFGSQYFQARIYTNDNANADIYMNFGLDWKMETGGSYQAYTTNFYHVTLTFTNGTAVAYRDGVPKSTNSFIDGSTGLPLSELTVRGPGGSLVSGFLEVGGDTHNGNPNLTPSDDSGDQYPNHAFWTGRMDDLRIYNRVLTTNEIYQIYSGTESGSSGGSSGGGGSSTGSLRITAQRATIGRIQGP